MLPLVMMTFTFPSLACYHHPSIGFPVYFFTLSLFNYYIEFSNIQVVVRTSKTTANPNQDFYSCQNWSPKVGQGCDLFEWCGSVPIEAINKVKTSKTQPAQNIHKL
ncbi:hypothetical protein LINPERPRIM_LOCUS11167 [Linum perenne]